MGDLPWKKRGRFGLPLDALRLHLTIAGATGSGKTETIHRIEYGARKVYGLQIIHIDAKGETPADEEERDKDNAARFVASMRAAGAQKIFVFPSTAYNGWHGTPQELKNRFLSVIDYSESAYYGDVAANALDLALFAPTTPRSSAHFLDNLNFERLKDIYKHDKRRYQRVLALDKQLLQQVEMRYQVFFSAMDGQLDGTLDYRDADAVYLRVRGFTLRDEAPRLGRFFVSDFMHYIATRRRAGVQTLFVIDEFNALRMREETSLLFEQVRCFGGCLVISSQGYTGLGPPEYAKRILDSCQTYVVHNCSDPFEITRRAGKRLTIDTFYSEDEEGNVRKHIRPRWDWKVPEDAVRRQEVGQAFWIHHQRAQQTQTALIPLTAGQIAEGWHEIGRQEHLQRQRNELETQPGRKEQAPTPQTTGTSAQPKPVPQQVTPQKPAARTTPRSEQRRPALPAPGRSAVPPKPPPIPSPDPDDDEPDRIF